MTRPPIYGLMAEFEHTEDVLEAARSAHEAGYRQMDAYTPFPVEGLPEAHAYCAEPAAADRPDRRPRRRHRRILHDVLRVGDPLPAQRRRPAAP